MGNIWLWRAATLGLAVAVVWLGLAWHGASQDLSEQAMRAAFYRARWDQVCFLVERCDQSDGCRTKAWCDKDKVYP